MSPPAEERRGDFPDLFSAGAVDYATYRPRYPARLFAELAALAPRTALAWDCGTGSGQAALGLVDHFTAVVATDASAAQIGQATPHPRIQYRVARAESSGLEDSAIDLITVAQAVHWFDRPRFYAEARRVLVANGVLAVWGYSLVEIAEPIDALIRDFYAGTLGPYWTPERRLVDEQYRTIDFPFADLVLPPLSIEANVTLPELRGYLRTWSAVVRYREAEGSDPVAPLIDRIAALWGLPSRLRRARWPLFVRAGRNDSAARSRAS